ncbi:hypothetical protein [Streptomyces turgidiscabies]|uniref:hypothetical protein n=1 Tax=Streptomyces turgidiscabies TaxID=85558 RepID=UPI0038F72627
MSTAAECAVCHQPIRSAAARARRVGSGCWRKLAPAERAVIRRLLKLAPALSTARVRAVLNVPAPPGGGQLPLDHQEITTP